MPPPSPTARARPSLPAASAKPRSQTPCSSHIRNRRQHVEPSGYPSGRSRQRAPVRKTHKIPRKHARLEAHGRPRPSWRRFGSGNNGTNTAHCSSLNKASRFFIEQAHHQPASHKSHSLEAAPIYATSSRYSPDCSGSVSHLQLFSPRACFGMPVLPRQRRQVLGRDARR